MQPNLDPESTAAIQQAMQRRGMGTPTPALSQTPNTPQAPMVNTESPSAMPRGIKSPLNPDEATKKIIVSALTNELKRLGVKDMQGGPNVQQNPMGQ